jgi:hypothetical protein
VAEEVAGTVASEKTLKLLGKIKAKQWKAMGEAIGNLQEFTESGGIDTLLGELGETWSLQVEDALAPLANEVNELVYTALEPIMPALVIAINEMTEFISISVKAWESIITGQWDEFFAWMNKTVSADMLLFKNELRAGLDSFFNTCDKMWKGFIKDWEAFWSDPLGGLGDLVGIDPGLQQTFDDLGAAWSGFWSDLGW